MADDWKVVGQRQTSVVQAGSFVPAYEVTFELNGDKGSGSVTVPVASYTADTVRQAIEDRVATMRAVSEL